MLSVDELAATWHVYRRARRTLYEALFGTGAHDRRKAIPTENELRNQVERRIGEMAIEEFRRKGGLDADRVVALLTEGSTTTDAEFKVEVDDGRDG